MFRVASIIAFGFVTACGVNAPRKVNDLGGSIPLHLIVSNQSYDIDPVDIDVHVDGTHVITGDFEVGTQHTYHTFDFEVTEGSHILRASGEEVELEEGFNLSAEMWGVLTFWFEEDTDEPKHFNWRTLHDEAPVFK